MGNKNGLGLDEIEYTSMGEFEVILTRGYWLGIYPVTQCQWQVVMDSNPSHFKDRNKPVEMIDWLDA